MSATLKVTHEPAFLRAAADKIGAGIRAAFQGKGAAKRVAQAAEASPRTVEAWLYGRVAPRSPELIALMAANDEFERHVLALVRDIREQTPCQNTRSGSASAGLDTPSAIP